MSHPEELELLEHGRTGWNRFDGVQYDGGPGFSSSPFERGRIMHGTNLRRRPTDLVDVFDRYLED